MGFKPTHTDCIALTVQRLNHSATLSAQSSFVCYLNRINKISKQICSASDRKIIRSQQKKRIKSSHCSTKTRLEVGYMKCIDEINLLVLEQD